MVILVVDVTICTLQQIIKRRQRVVSPGTPREVRLRSGEKREEEERREDVLYPFFLQSRSVSGRGSGNGSCDIRCS